MVAGEVSGDELSLLRFVGEATFDRGDAYARSGAVRSMRWLAQDQQLLGDVMGMPVVAINSMSRHSMKDHELHAFWSEAQDVIRDKLLAQVADASERERLTELVSLQDA